ncbi:MAG: DUF3108 domain-containing protein [Ideonella sp.]
MAGRLNIRVGWGARALLGLLLLLIHLAAVERLAAVLGAWKNRAAEAPRLQVVYLREMALTDPQALPAAGYRAPTPHLIQPAIELPIALLASADAAAIALAAQPASAPVEAQPSALPSPPDAPIEPMVAKDEAPAESAALDAVPNRPDQSPPESQSNAQASKSNSGSFGAPDFVWPASTRLRYVLSGNYRGEVSGWAQVEWVNAAPRYQVNLDVTIGLPFAPLYTREMRSDGRLDRGGLHPRHFQQESKLAFQPMRRVGIAIDRQTITDDDGRPLPTSFASAQALRSTDQQSTLQDSASQFVQMTYLFTTQPQLLTPGTRIGFPLVLPSGVRDWVYEVGQKETVYTRFGPIDAFHVKSAAGLARGSDQLLAEAWFAPRLAYLPVRLRIEQHAALYLDMILERIPELAAP